MRRIALRRAVSAAVAAAACLGAAPPALAIDPPANVRSDRPISNRPPTLAWDPVPGAVLYHVVRSATCGNGPYVGFSFAPTFTDARPFSESPAAPGTWAYVVRAEDGQLNLSADSNCVVITYDTAPPTLGDLQAQPQPDGSVALSWSVVDDSPVSLALRRSAPNAPVPSGPADGVAACETPAGSVGCSDTTAQSGAAFGYALYATDAAGNVAEASADVTAADVTAPSAPGGLVVVPGDGRLAISWSPVPAVGPDADLAGYRVVLGLAGAAPSSASDGTTACDIAPAMATSCLVDGLPDGQPVSVAVFARDEVPNWSPATPAGQATATPLGPPAPTPPVAPTPPLVPLPADHQPPQRPHRVALQVSPTAVSLRWRNPTDGDLDHVLIVRNAHHRPRTPADGSHTNAGLSATARLPAERGERFHLALYAYDRAGNVSLATTVDVAVPLLLPAAGGSFARAPLLSWRAVPHASYYNVVIRRAGRRKAIGWPTAASWRPGARLPAGLYRWYVWAGFGAKEQGRYGHLIGSSSFRIRAGA